MPSKSKAKGNKWENDVCKMMGDIFDLSFKRVPTSGAMTGGANSEILKLLSKSQKLLLRGDIIVPDELRKVVIECKSRKEFAYHQLLENNKEMNEWIDQLAHDLNEPSLIGLLIIKPNRRTPMVCWNDTCRYFGASRSPKWVGPEYNMILPKSYFNYYYNDNTYIIEPFTDEWVERNKQFLLWWSKIND